MLGRRQAGLIEFALQNCGDASIGGSLNTQEVSVAVESIGAAIEEGNVAGDHLLVAAREMSFRKVDLVGKFHNLAKKIGAGAEAFDDAGHLVASGAGTPEIISGGNFPGGFGVFGDMDLCGVFFAGRIGNRSDIPQLFFLIG
jgi:hypothetical protein